MIATRPSIAPAANLDRAWRRPSRWASVPRLTLLACAGLVMQLGWVTVWTLSYRLTHENDFTYTYLVGRNAVWEHLHDLLVLGDALAPGIEPPQNLDILVNSLVLAFVVAGLGYLAAVLLLDRGIVAVPGAMWVLLGGTLVFQATLAVMPGIFTTDVSSYMMYGQIAGLYNLNPYLYPPDAFPGNPLVEWIHPIWRHTLSVYGPLWTDLSVPFARLISPLSLTDQMLAYRLLMNGVHVVNLALVWYLLGRFAPGGGSHRARLTAFAMFAWNPLVLFEIAGNAHNDALMVTFLLLSLVPLAGALGARGRRAEPPAGRRIGNLRWLASTVFLSLSALIKYTTGVVGLFYAVAWVRQLRSWRAAFLWLAAAAAIAVALTLLTVWPWLKLPDILDPILDAAGGKMYTNSVPDLAALTVSDQILDPNALNLPAAQDTARFWLKVVTRAAFALYLLWEIRHVWRISGAGARAAAEAVVEASVRVFLVLLLVVLTWVLGWYFLWPLALTTFLGWRRMLSRVVVGLTLTSLPVFYYHHYWSWHMSGAALFAYALPPLLLPVVAWAWSRWAPRSLPKPLLVQPGGPAPLHPVEGLNAPG